MQKTHFHSWQKVVALLLAIVMLASPVLAQQVEMACADAQRDAERSISSGSWIAVGCLAGVVGVIVAYVMEPSPSASSLLGKSPEYVAAYTDCYREYGKKIRTKNAWNGCIFGTLVSVVLNMALAASQ